jgi:hypothetical protein
MINTAGWVRFTIGRPGVDVFGLDLAPATGKTA